MQRLLDKFGLWVALIVVGSIITYGIVSAYMRPEEAPAKGAGAGAKAAPAKSFD